MGSPCGIELGVSQHFIDPVEKTVRLNVFDLLCYIMYLFPSHPHYLRKEQFRKPVLA